MDSAFFLNNLPRTNSGPFLASQCAFNDFTQSQPFSAKLDFSVQKNHLLVQDDDENDDDIELVNSILSTTNESVENEGGGRMKAASIDPAGFLP